ncbi:putative amidase [Xylaria castorea]|nr:putative amidase [Xylaria castorea]
MLSMDSSVLPDLQQIPDIASLNIRQIRSGLEARLFKCVDLVETYVARINEVNERCRAVIAVHDAAMDVARICDSDYELGNPRGELHGVPILLKDLFNTDDSHDTTAGSLALVGARLGIEATLVRKLRTAGAIILGTTNLSQWANFRSDGMPEGWSAVGGQCLGPYAERQNPAGSSSGSAVAARLALAAACIGTENNGSITSPTSRACCIGYKPSVGLVSRTGAWPANVYQDCPGPLTRSVEDAARIVNVISGRDVADPLTDSIPCDFKHLPVGDSNTSHLKGARFAIPRSVIRSSVQDSEILTRFEQILDQLREHGAEVVDNVEYPSWTPAFSSETLNFVWSQLGKSMDEYFRTLKVNPHNVRSIDDLLTFMGSCPQEELSRYGASRLIKAKESPSLGHEAFSARLAKGSEIATILEQHNCDAILIPVGCRNPADLGQCPVMSLPMGFYSSERELSTDKHGMTLKGPNIPFGMLMIGKKWSDHKLVVLAAAYEKMIQEWRETMDQPVFLPTTELRDVLRKKLKKQFMSQYPFL